MGIFDRIILTVYTFLLTFLSAAFVALALGWRRPLEYVGQVLEDPNGRWAMGLTGAVFFVASVRLLYFAFRRGGGRAVVHENELGEVRISLDAVENLIARVARHQRGVRDVRVLTALSDGQVRAYLRVWVAADVAVPELGQSLQREVARQVREVMGAQVAEVRVHVVNVAPETRRPRAE